MGIHLTIETFFWMFSYWTCNQKTMPNHTRCMYGLLSSQYAIKYSFIMHTNSCVKTAKERIDKWKLCQKWSLSMFSNIQFDFFCFYILRMVPPSQFCRFCENCFCHILKTNKVKYRAFKTSRPICEASYLQNYHL